MTKMPRKKLVIKSHMHRDQREIPASPDLRADVFSLRARWIILGFIMLLLVLVRVRLLDVPLERDEGEYAYMGQLMLHGVPPYSAAYNMKFPGTYLMYALIMSVFGQTIQGIHLGFLILNCLTVLLLFFLGKRLVNDTVALFASGAYAILSLSPTVLGFAAHATHFVVVPALGGALLLQAAVEKNMVRHYFYSGTLFGLAYLMKQPGILFAGFGALYLLIHFSFSAEALSLRKKILNLTVFVSASLLPLLMVVAWLYTTGDLEKFWFWTVRYAAQYAAQIPLSLAFTIFTSSISSVVDGFLLFWIISFLGFLIVMFRRDLKKSRLFIILFTLFSFFSVCPGFYFRQHYFILFLPAVSILIGVFFYYLNTKLAALSRLPLLKYAGLGIFIAIALGGAIRWKDYIIKDSPVEISNKIYGDNPFDESIVIANFIAERSSPDDRILVFGSEPQIYFYAKRLSASGYIYTYSLMEDHDYALSMQKEMATEVEHSKPKFIVDVHVSTSWSVQQESKKYLFEWFSDYLKKNYRLVGVVDINTPDVTVYKWYDQLNNYTIPPPPTVLIYERLSNGKAQGPDQS
jgi:hypothetical protein